MKRVQVFQLREPTVVAIPQSASEIQYHSMYSRPVRLIGGEQPHVIPMAETITCHIHCLKHAVKGTFVRSFTGDRNAQQWIDQQYGPGYVYDEVSDIWVKTQYIAVEPELFEMFDQAARQPYEEREQVRAARLQTAHNQIEKHKRIIDNFWALPWYKRIWAAMAGGC